MKQHLLFKTLFVLAVLLYGMKMQAQEAYAVLSDEGQTVVFYYDTQKESRGGVDINSGYYSNPYSRVTTAVFDESFAGYRPTSTACWFNNCLALSGIAGMENLNTENVTDMSNMFSICRSLKSLDVSNFRTDNVTDMGYMFEDCSSLTNLDVSNFNTGNVTRMHKMFSYCPNMETVYAGEEWSTKSVTVGYEMFDGCLNLVGGQGTPYDGTHTDYTYAHIDGGAEAPGYFTRKVATDVKGVTTNADMQNVPIYDLSGQRLTASQRGINIVGGKKVVVK